MSSVQWIDTAGHLVEFDTDTAQVIVLDNDTMAVISGPRPASNAEITRWHELYPSPGDAKYNPTPRDTAMRLVNAALLSLRQITQDGAVSAEEMQGAMRLCEPAIVSLRDVELMDDELIHYTLLLLGQILFGYFFISVDARTALSNLFVQQRSLRQDMVRLMARVEALEAR